jgi:hypothetical protein
MSHVKYDTQPHYLHSTLIDPPLALTFTMAISAEPALPIKPCAKFLSVMGLDSLSENGVDIFPVVDHAEKLKFKSLGTLSLILPLVAIRDISRACVPTVQVILPPAALIFMVSAVIDFTVIFPLVFPIARSERIKSEVSMLQPDVLRFSAFLYERGR